MQLPVVISLSCLLPSAAVTGGGENAGEVFSLMTAARPAAMTAFTAVGDGAAGMEANAASLAVPDKPVFTGTFARMAGDMEVDSVGAVVPTPVVTAGVSAWLFRAGRVSVLDGTGTGGTAESQSDAIVSLGLGRRVWGGVKAGAQVKWYRSVLLERYRAESWSADGGIMWTDPRGILTIGAAVRNAGRGLGYLGERNPLPTSLAGGVGWRALSVGPLDAIIAADYSTGKGLGPGYAVGAEITVFKRASLRAGFQRSGGVIRPGFGLGLKTGHVSVDFASATWADNISVNRASLSLFL